MINVNLLSRWQNWAIIFLMVAIPMTAFHSFIDHIDGE